MDHAGLSHHDFAVALRSLTQDHARRVHIDLVELNAGKHISDLSDRLLDGEVQYDVTADVSRTLDVRLVDDRRANLGFDPVDASSAPIHRSRMLRVTDARWIDQLGVWVGWRVFTGPVYDFERDAGEIMVTAHGLERQALGAIWDTMHFKAKKAKITDVIRQLLAAVGDVNASVPDLDHKLPHDLVLHQTDIAWPHIQKLAAAADHYAFYDGAARFRMRRHQQKPVAHFDARWLLSDVKPHRGALEHNTWIVLGPNPKGPKERPRGVAFLRGPNSPAGLARHNVGHHLVNKREMDHLKHDRQAQKIADRMALEHGTVRTDLSFDVIPPPFLEEHDMVGVTSEAFGKARVRGRQWNLPLAGGDTGGSAGPPTTIGTNRRTVKAKVRHP